MKGITWAKKDLQVFLLTSILAVVVIWLFFCQVLPIIWATVSSYREKQKLLGDLEKRTVDIDINSADLIPKVENRRKLTQSRVLYFENRDLSRQRQSRSAAEVGTEKREIPLTENQSNPNPATSYLSSAISKKEGGKQKLRNGMVSENTSLQSPKRDSINSLSEKEKGKQVTKPCPKPTDPSTSGRPAKEVKNFVPTKSASVSQPEPTFHQIRAQQDEEYAECLRRDEQAAMMVESFDPFPPAKLETEKEEQFLDDVDDSVVICFRVKTSESRVSTEKKNSNFKMIKHRFKLAAPLQSLVQYIESLQLRTGKVPFEMFCFYPKSLKITKERSENVEIVSKSLVELGIRENTIFYVTFDD